MIKKKKVNKNIMSVNWICVSFKNKYYLYYLIIDFYKKQNVKRFLYQHLLLSSNSYYKYCYK